MSTPDVTVEFRRLRSHLERLAPGSARTFNPPATADELERLDEVLDGRTPPELRALLSEANGQDDPSGVYGMINHLSFCSVDELVRFHRELADAVGDMVEPRPQPSAYRWSVWSPDWIPVMTVDGDALMIDLDPGETGTVGQVFVRPNAPDLDEPLASSLGGYLARANELIEAGEYEVDDDVVTIVDLY
ncbi:SMI1/KNR4 family protein [Cellulomonas sp. NPDC089187]|uniref:SMI1/KNR4 family protein n=1 Tax=Cellulomonas sp. NPDC089187 TaxID=3154970 RepID=UPI00341A44E6